MIKCGWEKGEKGSEGNRDAEELEREEWRGIKEEKTRKQMNRTGTGVKEEKYKGKLAKERRKWRKRREWEGRE